MVVLTQENFEFEKENQQDKIVARAAAFKRLDEITKAIKKETEIIQSIKEETISLEQAEESIKLDSFVGIENRNDKVALLRHNLKATQDLDRLTSEKSKIETMLDVKSFVTNR
jgi:hypothetical protein